MNVYQAISEMRRLTKIGKTFSFTFATFSISRDTGHGITQVRNAKLQSKKSDFKHPHRDFVELYIDPQTGDLRQFYHPLLMSFNGQKVDLI